MPQRVCEAESRAEFEIRVCINPAAHLSLYEKLRLALHASTWFARPLGIVLWSVLHVMLVVAGSAFLVPYFISFFLLSLSLDLTEYVCLCRLTQNLTWSCVKKSTCRMLARWCEEIVHMHDAILLFEEFVVRVPRIKL